MGSVKQLPSGLCPERWARVPPLCGPARGPLGANQGIQQQERRSPAAERGSGSAKQLPPGSARSGWQGSHTCVGRPAACRVWIRASGSKSAARLWRSGAAGAQGVRSSSTLGFARSGGQGSHSCVDRPAACRGQIGHLAARAPLADGGAGLGGCEAAPLRALPASPGKGPTLVWTGPRHAGADRVSGSKNTARLRRRSSLRAVPGAAGKGPTRVWTGPRPAGCGSGHLAARASLAGGGAGLGEYDSAPLRALPGVVGKGPTLVWTGPLPAWC